MKHKSFTIKNFKGVEKVRIDFDAQPRSRVYTLVGLNESGKTTILEALNFFTYKTENLDPLDLPGYSIKDVHELIPISKRSNFNETISIGVEFEMDEEDNEKLKQYPLKENGFELTQLIKDFLIEQVYQFNDSKIVENQPKVFWAINFKGKRGRSKAVKELSGEDWQKAIRYVSTLLPSVLFFPNFLFEFPDKIYLETVAEEPEKHEFYRTILQDVLDAVGKHHKLDRHVLDRAKSDDRNDWRALDSVLLEMGTNITSTVFGSWNRIFRRRIGNKEIAVKCDKDEKGKWYLQLRLRDGSELYAISERSLGFRWFFTFLLLTQYRGFRKGSSRNTLFLFDEPASNLHPSAQSQLLESFGKFPDSCSIIYTTHSHHLVNPNWLEGTYVVKNEGLDYDAEEDNYNAKNTSVTLHKYRNFAANHPNQTTYFQPVLDVLDYRPSELENVPSVVMVEGKNDFYTLKYFQDKVSQTSRDINLMPGTGSGSLDNVIRLYVAWGRKFIVLLDSDKAGLEQKKRYEDMYGVLVQDRIFSLRDIDSTWTKEMESLISEDDRRVIQSLAYPDSKKFNKTHFNRAIQELYLTNQRPNLMTVTVDRFEKLLGFCAERLTS